MEINLNNYSMLTLDDINKYKELIIKDKLEIISKIGNGVITVIPYNQLNVLFYENLKNNSLFSNAEFYIYKTYLDMIDSLGSSSPHNTKEHFYSVFINCKEPIADIAAKEEAIFDEIFSMDDLQRLQHIRKSLKALEIEETKDVLTSEAANLIGETLLKFGIIQRLNIINNIKFEDANSNMLSYDELIINFTSIVLSLLNKNYEKPDIFDNVIGFNGLNKIDHSNRVYINVIEFMIYYNKNINMGVLSKIRAKWKSEYFPYYQKVAKKYLFSKDVNKLDNVFKSGVRQFDNSEIVHIAIAALLHDINFTEISNYLPVEGTNYNIHDLYSHPIKSYNYLKNSIYNNQDINLAVGLHHEYYGYGYGLAINLFEAMRSKNPGFKYKHLISFDSKDILNLTTAVYYPSKILEILDMYDSLKYKYDVCFNDISTDIDIINFLYDNFLQYEVKIDYIIFTVFKKYLMEKMGVEI